MITQLPSRPSLVTNLIRISSPFSQETVVIIHKPSKLTGELAAVSVATELKQAIKKCLIFSPHQINASVIPGKTWEHGHCLFSFKYYITALIDFSQLLHSFFNLVDSPLVLVLL